jgi:hypothetical protein
MMLVNALTTARCARTDKPRDNRRLAVARIKPAVKRAAKELGACDAASGAALGDVFIG